MLVGARASRFIIQRFSIHHSQLQHDCSADTFRVRACGALEKDTCRDYVLPRLKAAGWTDDQIVEQYRITDGRIVMVAKKHRRANTAAGGLRARVLARRPDRSGGGQTQIRDSG